MMSILRALRSSARLAVMPACFLGLAVYFLAESLDGPHGTIAGAERTREIVAARETLAAAERELEGLERRVRGMRDEPLSPDLLDERARQLLGMVAPGDIVIPYDDRGVAVAVAPSAPAPAVEALVPQADKSLQRSPIARLLRRPVRGNPEAASPPVREMATAPQPD